MCSVNGSRLFVRGDSSPLIEEILPDVAKTNITPASHMNYGGGAYYSNSGYLSLFEYIPGDDTLIYRSDAYRKTTTAARALLEMNPGYIHFIFIPPTVNQINIDESNVRSIPNVGRTPTLLNTEACRPPARITEDGDVIEYATRYISEYLYLGSWAKGIKVITERYGMSGLLPMLTMGKDMDSIGNYCNEKYPCPPGGPDDSPGPGGSSVCV
ncbi:hypothetical protein [Microbulbifer halophilus]|uniref:Uncharacterized protein n=1 Tax=Microbulbifer halophilus TaxID=453963 RepID=A0ABW5E886_9GAMM|nr:hypothetical protein [Microbulbifer halophilus]MCW8126730.1 hypothetical protein [Microbulbifer halophilus]